MKNVSLFFILLGLVLLLGYGVYSLFLFDAVLGVGTGSILLGLLFGVGQNNPKQLYKND